MYLRRAHIVVLSLSASLLFSAVGCDFKLADASSSKADSGTVLSAGRVATNLYRAASSSRHNLAMSAALPRVYVSHVRSNDVYVIDPSTYRVVDRFKVGKHSQHIVPSWDLATLWVANNAGGPYPRKPDSHRSKDS